MLVDCVGDGHKSQLFVLLDHGLVEGGEAVDGLNAHFGVVEFGGVLFDGNVIKRDAHELGCVSC